MRLLSELALLAAIVAAIYSATGCAAQLGPFRGEVAPGTNVCLKVAGQELLVDGERCPTWTPRHGDAPPE